MLKDDVIVVVGAALSVQQQLFVSVNLPQLLAWLQTDLGKLALQTFVADWQAATQK